MHTEYSNHKYIPSFTVFDLQAYLKLKWGFSIQIVCIVLEAVYKTAIHMRINSESIYQEVTVPVIKSSD